VFVFADILSGFRSTYAVNLLDFPPLSSNRIYIIFAIRLTMANASELTTTGVSQAYTPFQTFVHTHGGTGTSVVLDNLHALDNHDFQVPEDLSQYTCVECVKGVPVTSFDEISVGDHIVFSGTVYNHHAIVVQKHDDHITEIGFSRPVGIKWFLIIRRTDHYIDFANEKVLIVNYRRPVFTKRKIAVRAQRFCEYENVRLFPYNVVDNNCEHFATLCTTGRKFSVQVSKVRVAVSLGLRGLNTLGSETLRTQKLFELGYLCKGCFTNLRALLLDADVRKVERQSDVHEGDIVRFLYYGLQHDGIVMSVDERNEGLFCDVAHYAFCGFSRHRRIVVESYHVPIDGSWSIVNYRRDKYPANTVVDRARYRVGEENFSFYVNDSCHFARWCQLVPSERNSTPGVGFVLFRS